MSIFLIAAIIFAIGAIMVVMERPGLSRAGFALEAVAGVLAVVGLLL